MQHGMELNFGMVLSAMFSMLSTRIWRQQIRRCLLFNNCCLIRSIVLSCLASASSTIVHCLPLQKKFQQKIRLSLYLLQKDLPTDCNRALRKKNASRASHAITDSHARRPDATATIIVEVILGPLLGRLHASFRICQAGHEGMGKAGWNP